MEDNKKSRKGIDPALIAVVGFLSMVLMVVAIVLGPGSLQYIKACIVLMVISIVAMVCGAIGMIIENQNDDNKIIENKNKFQQEYDDYVEKHGIVKSDTQVTLIEVDDEYDIEFKIPQYLWIENGVLNMFPMSRFYKEYHTSTVHKPDISMLQLKTISIESILYFEEIGELRQYTSVSGGGTSLKGALLGYVIADDVGAIIGSRQPVKTKVISNDERIIELIYKNNLGEIENLEFSHDAYKVFKHLMPMKELRRINGLKASESLKDEIEPQESQTIKDKLIQLNNLRVEGLITEDEYLEQRTRILESF